MSPRKPARTRASSRTPSSIDAYLEPLDDERRGLLASLRRTIRAALGGALDGFSRTKSALHFDAERPLPAALVRKLLRARLAELPRAAAKRPRPAG